MSKEIEKVINSGADEYAECQSESPTIFYIEDISESFKSGAAFAAPLYKREGFEMAIKITHRSDCSCWSKLNEHGQRLGIIPKSGETIVYDGESGKAIPASEDVDYQQFLKSEERCYSRHKEPCEWVGGKCVHCGKPLK